jgi:molybdate transport system ATP-binding protein
MVSPEAWRMSVDISGLRLPLAHFTLELDVVLDAPMTALFGASGSGKTSLLEVIAGLRRPAAGSVKVDGEIVSDTAPRLFVPPHRRAIGYVPQDGALFPHLSVRRNLLYGAPASGAASAGLTFEHVTEVLEITHLADRVPATLSAGEKQRVALGRALLAAPRLLLLDEPLAGLDLPLRERLLPYLLRVRDEFRLPMIYVTHSPDEVMALCPEVLVLERGRATRRGRSADIFALTSNPRYELRATLPSAS